MRRSLELHFKVFNKKEGKIKSNHVNGIFSLSFKDAGRQIEIYFIRVGNASLTVCSESESSCLPLFSK
jgi:hypothetical protein